MNSRCTFNTTLILGLLICIGSAGANLVHSEDVPANTQNACDVGPLTRSFGGTPWLVYSCPNPKTPLILVSAPGSAAFPFVFAFVVEKKELRIYGEGTGNKTATEAALKELKRLSPADVTALVQLTKAVQTNNSATPTLDEQHLDQRLERQ